jgi:hypothetical protein
MNLRSGRKLSNLRRDSRNYEEFNERRRYQREQRQLEETLYDEEETEETKIKKKFDNVCHKTQHLIYLNNFQKENNHSLTDKINTIMELYEVFRYNIYYIVEYSKNRKDKRLPEAFFNKGPDLCKEMARSVRTRKEKKLYEKCKEDINWVRYLIDYYILSDI